MKVYIVKQITTNYSEPREYASHESSSIVGVYSSYASALDKVDELHETYNNARMTNSEFDYISESCEIEEHELIP